MDHAEFLDPFQRLLEDVAPITGLRAAESGDTVQDMWSALNASGYLDLLVEADGDPAVSAAIAGRIMAAAGRHLVPAPIGETMIARALLARAGVECVTGPILLVTPVAADGGYRAPATPHAAVAQYALVDMGTQLKLTALDKRIFAPVGVPASQSRALVWDSEPEALAVIPRPADGLRPLATLVRVAAIAGAADRVARMTVDYAGTRTQFGKPIGSYQAIQQQLAVMGEQAVMARTAAQIAFGGGFPPALRAVAIAKQIAGNAAQQIAAIAHAVHGAIGFSEAYDLQLYTRRLHEWRLADGSESYWAKLLGTERLAGDAGTIDFVRAHPTRLTADEWEKEL